MQPLLADYLPIVVFIVIAGAIAVAMIGGSLLAARQKPYAEKVSAFIKNTIGITAQVRAVAPETLERSLGKAKRVRDKRPKG